MSEDFGAPDRRASQIGCGKIAGRRTCATTREMCPFTAEFIVATERERENFVGYQEHQRSSDQIVADCAVVTLSDTRTASTDRSGARIKELVTADGHNVVAYHILKDEPNELD